MATSYDPKQDKDRPANRIEEARQTIAGSLAEIAGEMQELTDLRSWVRKEPWLFMGGAAVVGFLLAGRPKALTAIAARLVPMLAGFAAKPMLEELGKNVGARFAPMARA